VGNVTQIFLNYMTPTEETLSLCSCWLWIKYGTGLQQDSNYAADVMYKPQDTGRRNRVCLEFVWEQMKKQEGNRCLRSCIDIFEKNKESGSLNTVFLSAELLERANGWLALMGL